MANALTAELLKQNLPVRLVSRRPVTTFAGAQWKGADLLVRQQVLNAVEGATVIYCCAGLVYDKKVWQQQWPLVMENLVAAGGSTGARVVFFDNVYMYGPVAGAMTEATPHNPTSVKGTVRAAAATRFMQAVASGQIQGCILRGADFYGSESLNSFFDGTVLAKYAKGQKATWLGNPATKHSFTYVPDAGKAMYTLGQHPEADGQVWHAPTPPALTGHQFLQLAADAFSTKPRYGTVNKLMMQAVGLFVPTVRESVELYYQYGQDYVFDSGKFERAFGVKPTPYAEGIAEVARWERWKK